MRTILLDCNNLCYIQRHTFGDDLSHEEESTGIMWGFFGALMRLAKQFDTSKFVFAWDSRTNIRKDMDPNYKANRHQDPAEKETMHNVWKQFSTIHDELLPVLGFRNNFKVEGFEADDIIAWMAREYLWPELPVAVSTDKDLYQILDVCDVYRPLPGNKKVLVTIKDFRNEYGIEPRQWVYMRALEGDGSDNIAGIPGVGQKTALRFVRGELSARKILGIIMNPESNRLADHNLALMELPHPDFPPLVLSGGEELSLDSFLQMCDRYGFQSFLKPKSLREWRQRFKMV